MDTTIQADHKRDNLHESLNISPERAQELQDKIFEDPDTLVSEDMEKMSKFCENLNEFALTCFMLGRIKERGLHC